MPNVEPDYDPNTESIIVPNEPDNNSNNYPNNEPDEVSYAEQISKNETPITITKPKQRGRPKKVTCTSQNIQSQAASNEINIQPTITYVVGNRQEDRPENRPLYGKKWICVPVKPK